MSDRALHRRLWARPWATMSRPWRRRRPSASPRRRLTWSPTGAASPLSPGWARDHRGELRRDEVDGAERGAGGRPGGDGLEGGVDQALGPADRAGARADAAVVEDLHGDVKALAGLAEHVLGRERARRARRG